MRGNLLTRLFARIGAESSSAGRFQELREAGLTPQEAAEAIEEEHALQARQRKERKEAIVMPRATRVTGTGKPDFSNLKPQPIVAVRDGVGYTAEDIVEAEAADGVGNKSDPNEQVYRYPPDESPTRREWLRQKEEAEAAREAQDRRIYDAAKAELDRETEEERERDRIESMKERMRLGPVRAPEGR